ncbi:helicase-related protein [Sandaracinobacteroides saxicola]|uniref:Helicase n=1 Tax=Sandaracinobacteroides saxicola TaxID=2759707 RepID=A0A7G5IJ27_9SPHN|nr:helicase-related protein [Sandaracinobacteroides saxicola]QMW23369.1 helicase [Sandaracinobacteroides saxicola]
MTGLRSQLTAVLGPTNTGKTHLAIDRMCGHASGMIGFPLRLLAREVYDRVVKIKGAAQVALVTGEEKIVPAGARYFLCTAESMPTDRAPAFVAIDEAQMGADPERGHVFTDRLLHSRGTAETMILGSETLRPLIRRLLPDAEIVNRPRFSTLSYSGAKKLSRLPPRTALVAFTTEDVYALAEMLRRHKGGAAVVMGGLSPRTRNAQVEMFQSGEVDYLVATDAIGMGLNMDIAHVAFASLAKYDGRRHRKLTAAELAQIAGRAGRHQRDGSFGTVQLGQADGLLLDPENVEAIEGHHFPPLTSLFWRNARLDFHSLHRLMMSLDARATAPELHRGDDAIDVAVLKKLAGEPWVMERARGVPALQRLWAACGLPDYRRTGVDQHAKLVSRIYRHLSEGSGHLPPEWLRSELAILDNVAGDIATLSDRIAAARTWTYVAHRADWLADAAGWAERTRAVEDKLSDALHARLMQRFVDRRTAVLLRDLSVKDPHLRVEVDPDGTVVVDGAIIGTLAGFRFTPDPSARAGEKKMLLAAAERRLAREYATRAAALAGATDSDFALGFDGGMPPRLLWRGARIASLRRGKDALHPRVELDRSLEALTPADRAKAQARLETWLAAATAHHLSALTRVAALAPQLSAPARGLVVQLVETMGSLTRASVDPLIHSLTQADRRALHKGGVRLGVTHVFVAHALKPEATRWRLALWGVAAQVAAMPAPPAPGRVSLTVNPDAPPGFYEVAGYWRVEGSAVRVDMADRLARALHEQRLRDKAGGNAFVPDAPWAATLGLQPPAFRRVMRALGFRAAPGETPAFAWRGAPRDKTTGDAAPASASPFAGLAGLMGV